MMDKNYNKEIDEMMAKTLKKCNLATGINEKDLKKILEIQDKIDSIANNIALEIYGLQDKMPKISYEYFVAMFVKRLFITDDQEINMKEMLKELEEGQTFTDSHKNEFNEYLTLITKGYMFIEILKKELLYIPSSKTEEKMEKFADDVEKIWKKKKAKGEN